jgi:hypothetical protein
MHNSWKTVGESKPPGGAILRGRISSFASFTHRGPKNSESPMTENYTAFGGRTKKCRKQMSIAPVLCGKLANPERAGVK